MTTSTEQGPGRPEEDVLTQERLATRQPRRWRVLLHNDDYTTMEFVVHVLMTHFGKARAEATNITMQVHHRGVGLAGVYPKDVAATKADAVMREARQEGMPLMLSTEPE